LHYTLSAADVPVSGLSADITRRLPRYPSVPAARIGRLAIDQRVQGHGLGGALLLNAAMRILRSEIAVFALVVDAKDDEAAAFYRHHGFSAFASNPLQLIAPIETVCWLLGEYREHKRPFRQVPGVFSGRQAAVNLPATRYRPESQPLEPGKGPQEKAIGDGF